MDQQLLRLYSPDPDNEFGCSKNESPARESIEDFSQILDSVENEINNRDTVERQEIGDSAFAGLFSGITDFPYEGSDYIKEEYQNNSTKERTINLGSELWNKGVHPGEF